MVELVEIGKEDIRQCIEIYNAAFGYKFSIDSPNDFERNYVLDRLSSLEHYFVECIDKDCKYALCLKDDTKIVGFITAWDILSPDLGDSIYVDTIAVAPECQKKGYGTTMINEFVRTISKDKIIVLNTKKNLPAYDLYKKLGFVETEFVTMQRSPIIEKLIAELEEQKALLKTLMAEKAELLQKRENEQSPEK